MPTTREEAERLGLAVEPLLTWCFDLNHPRRLKRNEQPLNLVYSLDDLEVSTKVFKRTEEAVPPDTFICPNTGLPLRPLYYDRRAGMVKRAVPIDWNEGVDYLEWRDLQEKKS